MNLENSVPAKPFWKHAAKYALIPVSMAATFAVLSTGFGVAMGVDESKSSGPFSLKNLSETVDSALTIPPADKGECLYEDPHASQAISFTSRPDIGYYRMGLSVMWNLFPEIGDVLTGHPPFPSFKGEKEYDLGALPDLNTAPCEILKNPILPEKANAWAKSLKAAFIAQVQARPDFTQMQTKTGIFAQTQVDNGPGPR